MLLPLAPNALILGGLMGLLGIVQGASSPSSLAMIGCWYPNRERGMYVAIWNTSQNVGASFLAFGASALLSHTEYWQLVFWIPALLAFVCAWYVYTSSADRPWQEGYPTLQEIYGRAGVPHSDVSREDSYWRLLWSALTSTPVLWLLIVLNGLLYFVRFGVINWMPHFLANEKPFILSHANQTIAWLEIGAIPAVLFFAYLAYHFPASMTTIGALSMFFLALALLFYQGAMTENSLQWSALVIGAFVYAPQVVVNVLTLNLIPQRMAGAAVGIVGLSGYLIGEVAANLVLPRIALIADWQTSHTLLVLMTAVAGVVYAYLRPFEKRAVVLQNDEQ